MINQSNHNALLILGDYLHQINRLYGDEIAGKSHAWYSKGWFYIGVAHKYPDGSIGNADLFTHPYRKNRVLEMIENLKNREPVKEATHEP